MKKVLLPLCIALVLAGCGEKKVNATNKVFADEVTGLESNLNKVKLADDSEKTVNNYKTLSLMNGKLYKLDSPAE